MSEGLIKYIGETFNSVRHGFGIQTWKDGAEYIGDWKDHKASGAGRFRHADGDVYLGIFI